MAKKKRKIPDHLTPAMVKIKEHLDQTYPFPQNAKTIALHTKLSYGTVRNYLEDDFPLIKDKLAIKDTKGFYKGIGKYVISYKDTLAKLPQKYSEFLSQLSGKKVPLGVHMLTLRLDLQSKDTSSGKFFYDTNKWNVDYDNLDWNITTYKAQKGKSLIIDELSRFGRTEITIFGGTSKKDKAEYLTAIPSIRIDYNGTIFDEKGKPRKRFLTREKMPYGNYNEWITGVNTVLKTYPNIKLSDGVLDFKVKQIHFNWDFELKDNGRVIECPTVNNVRFHHLMESFEYYEYKEEDDYGIITKKGRVGGSIVNTDEDLDESDPLSAFANIFGVTIEQQNKVNYLVSNLEKLPYFINQVFPQLTNQLAQLGLKTQDVLNHTVADNRKNITDFKAELENKFTELNTEIDNKLNTSSNFLQTEMSGINNELTDFKNQYLTDFQALDTKLDDVNVSRDALANGIQLNAQTITAVTNNLQILTNLIETIRNSGDSNYQQTMDIAQQLGSQMKILTDNQNKISQQQLGFDKKLDKRIHRIEEKGFFNRIKRLFKK
jgi:hypothetical protein